MPHTYKHAGVGVLSLRRAPNLGKLARATRIPVPGYSGSSLALTRSHLVAYVVLHPPLEYHDIWHPPWGGTMLPRCWWFRSPGGTIFIASAAASRRLSGSARGLDDPPPEQPRGVARPCRRPLLHHHHNAGYPSARAARGPRFGRPWPSTRRLRLLPPASRLALADTRALAPPHDIFAS